ncbi:RHO1 GDP-GTP exchange protein 2 [Coemansia spiralis]|uniref:RHO1 GDP-GTP exchange protein 2 n=1 Tax=Coemansia spiralis TaxID=417178 RepID=A0A9W8GD21_9FUNG|nr:RHO1 GDP-GTP exchange protein 2 [Coemansia spiralis]
MDRRNPQSRSDNLAFTGLGDLDFDRPAPPAQPKRLQRLSRSSNTNPHSQLQQQRANTISRQYLQRENHRQQQQHPQQQQHSQYRSQYYHSQQHLPLHQSQGVQQQMMHGRPSYSFDEPHSPTSQSDIGPASRPPVQAPMYSRTNTNNVPMPGVRAHMPQNSPQMRPNTSLPVPYPSAMVVGGGMPAGSRIAPSQALVNAVASTEINRHQRERDLANALGRRRPTQGSVSSSGSSDYVLGAAIQHSSDSPFNANAPIDQSLHHSASHPGAPPSGTQGRYRAPLPLHAHPQSHGTVDMRVGRSTSSASSLAGGYRGAYAPSPYATQRRPPPHMAPGPEQDRLRKQASAMSMNATMGGASGNSAPYVNAPAGEVPYRYVGADASNESPNLRHAHPGSRSAPDLQLDAMKVAINDVAHNLDRNPVPQIPAAYSNVRPQNPQMHNHLPQQHLPPGLPPVHPSNLSIRTDISHEGSHSSSQSQLDQPPSYQQYGAATAHYPTTAGPFPAMPPPSAPPADFSVPVARQKSSSSSGAGSAVVAANGRPQSRSVRVASKTPASSDVGLPLPSPSARNEPVPVNAELVALLENVKPVYPAMISLVAKSFCEIICQVLQTHVRNGLEHTQCFTGRDAVDAIYAIIKAADRNLAIVVGRALEQQSLFHDVDYEKRLRDDPNELYAFDDDVVRALLRPNEQLLAEDDEDDADEEATLNQGVPGHHQNARGQSRASLSVHSPTPAINGVFVMLTDCYSPTCSNSQPCYSVTCPRQRLQQDHLRKTAKSNVAAEMKQEKLWSMSVPKEIVKSVSRQELDRQERLYEVFYGEKDYVRDLCILRDLYMKPLHNSDIVREDRRKNFITKVFKNALAVLAENMELHKALEKRQKENFICYQVGDVFLPFVQRLEAYLEYCANQPYSMHFLDAEKRNNARLVDFLEKTDRRPECRKLGVQHFLTRPPTRLARYPLVLKAVLKYTPEGHPDRETIPHVIERIEAMLNRINAETGKAQNRLRLFKVDDKLVCSVADRNNLRLTDDQRKLVRDSQLRKRGGNEASAIQMLLLDHMLLMCKVKTDSHTGEEKYTIYKHPIPLQLLTICNPDDPNSTRPRMAARRDSTSTSHVLSPSGTIGSVGGSIVGGKAATTNSPSSAADTAVGRGTSASTSSAPAAIRPTIFPIDNNDSQKDKYSYPLQFTHLGRAGFTVTLYANKLADRQQWYQCIEQQQLELMDRHRKFELVPVAGQFPSGIRVNTADVYDQGRGVVIGTDRGLYLGVAGKPRSFQMLSHLKHDRVYQIEIHERLNVMAMIADKDRNLYVYPLDLLMTATTNSRNGVRIKPLHAHVSFFRFGQFQDLDILCSVRSTTLSNQTIIHVYKPVINQQKSRSLGRFLSLGAESGADSWKCIKECYIAAESTSLHFLRSRLCVGCSRGFEIVDLATMNTQSLLDPADTSLSFINKRDTTHPIALFRVHDGEFLLCYDVFAFYVNRNGQRARHNWMIHWVGMPTSFKFEYPYILAFDSQFIEVHHVETAAMVQVMITGNCTSLSPNKTHVNLCVTSPSPTQSQEVMRIQHILAKDPL